MNPLNNPNNLSTGNSSGGGLPPRKRPPTNSNYGGGHNNNHGYLPEQPLYKATPHLSSYFLKGNGTEVMGKFFSLFLIFPIFSTVIELLRLKKTTYYFSSQRIKIDSGLFELSEDWILLFRVRDISKKQWFLYRFFGLADIQLYSTDTTTPVYVFQGLPLRDVNKLVPVLQNCIAIERNRHRPDMGPWNTH